MFGPGETACDDGVRQRPEWKGSSGKLLAPISQRQCFHTFPLPTSTPQPYPPTISPMPRHSHQRTSPHLVSSCCKICCYNQPLNVNTKSSKNSSNLPACWAPHPHPWFSSGPPPISIVYHCNAFVLKIGKIIDPTKNHSVRIVCLSHTYKHMSPKPA